MLGRFTSRKVAALDAQSIGRSATPPAPLGDSNSLARTVPQLATKDLQSTDDYLSLKVALHHHLIERFNLSAIEDLDAAAAYHFYRMAAAKNRGGP